MCTILRHSINSCMGPLEPSVNTKGEHLKTRLSIRAWVALRDKSVWLLRGNILGYIVACH